MVVTCLVMLGRHQCLYQLGTDHLFGFHQFVLIGPERSNPDSLQPPAWLLTWPGGIFRPAPKDKTVSLICRPMPSLRRKRSSLSLATWARGFGNFIVGQQPTEKGKLKPQSHGPALFVAFRSQTAVIVVPPSVELAGSPPVWDNDHSLQFAPRLVQHAGRPRFSTSPD